MGQPHGPAPHGPPAHTRDDHRRYRQQAAAILNRTALSNWAAPAVRVRRCEGDGPAEVKERLPGDLSPQGQPPCPATARIAGSQLVICGATGHIVLWECPERIAEDVAVFLGQGPGESTPGPEGRSASGKQS